MPKNKVEQDLEPGLLYHRREWRVQRIGWAAMALLLAAAAAGVFGGGPASEVTLQATPAGSLHYERFARHGSTTLLRINASGETYSQGELVVQITRPLIDDFRIESITPEPLRTHTSSDVVEYSFAATAATAAVVFRLEPDRIGSHAGDVRIGSSQPLRLRQFVYP